MRILLVVLCALGVNLEAAAETNLTERVRNYIATQAEGNDKVRAALEDYAGLVQQIVRESREPKALPPLFERLGQVDACLTGLLGPKASYEKGGVRNEILTNDRMLRDWFNAVSSLPDATDQATPAPKCE